MAASWGLPGTAPWFGSQSAVGGLWGAGVGMSSGCGGSKGHILLAELGPCALAEDGQWLILLEVP